MDKLLIAIIAGSIASIVTDTLFNVNFVVSLITGVIVTGIVAWIL